MMGLVIKHVDGQQADILTKLFPIRSGDIGQRAIQLRLFHLISPSGDGGILLATEAL